PSSWTLPSVAGTVSSRNPIVTGRYYNESYAAGATTFAAELRKSGYFTAAVVKNPWLPARDAGGELLPTIVRYGFDHYEVGGAKLEENPFFAEGIGAPRELVSFAPAEAASTEVLDIIKAARAQGKRGPFCLYIHYMNTHQPYSPAARHLPIADAAAPGVEGIPDHLIYQVFFSRAKERDFAAPIPAEDVPLVERGRALYDAATASVDEAVGALSEGLRKAGELSNTVFLFTSDHGEEFAERGRCGHSVTLYQESIRVPLIVWGARVQRGLRIPALVSGVDMAPEITAAAGCEPVEDFEGAGLGLFTRGGAAEAVGCTVAPTLPGELETLTMSLVRGDGVKLILKCGAGGAKGDRTLELYDLKSDPDERRDLAGEGKETAGLAERLDRYFAAAAARPAMRRLSVDDETRELLRSLGYAN
ncbi:MAG: sulfatase family protein, partial [Planctomycetota bacterium]